MNFNKKDLVFYIYCFFILLITYGFPLTNNVLSIDSESTIYADYSLSLGRWGTNLIRYHIFKGLIPYFTLLLGLIFYSLSFVILNKILKFKGFYKYLFALLCLTFPQMSYQFVFTMQADVIGIGIFIATLSIFLFLKYWNEENLKIKITIYFIVAFLVMITIALYQALALYSIIIYLIYLFIQTFKDNYDIKKEVRKTILISLCFLTGGLFYYISLKIINIDMNSSYLLTYSNNDQENRLINFLKILFKNLKGDFYYGEKSSIIASFSAIVLILYCAFTKKYFFERLFLIILILVTPYFFSLLITNNYHPPRIFMGSSLTYGFLITFLFFRFNKIRLFLVTASFICLYNIYCVTNLFQNLYNINLIDKNFLISIDNRIKQKFPDFNPKNDFIYFYGFQPYEVLANERLPESEIFGGSFFNWDNCDNYRIKEFSKFYKLESYNLINNPDDLQKVESKINEMNIFPNDSSIIKVDNILMIKIGDQKGALLPFQK